MRARAGPSGTVRRLLPRLQPTIDFYHQHKPDASRQIGADRIARPVRPHINPRYADEGDQDAKYNLGSSAQRTALQQDVAQEEEETKELNKKDHVAGWEAILVVVAHHFNQAWIGAG